MPKTASLESPEDVLNLSKRYLQNAREMLKRAGVDEDIGAYEDVKYVSSASGIAYLSALEAIRALLMEKMGWDASEVEKRTREIGRLRQALKGLPLGKDRDRLLKLLRDVYNILHLGGYYRRLQSKKAIDDGFEKVERIIRMVEKHIGAKLSHTRAVRGYNGG